MDVLLFLVFGLVIGAIARLIVPGHERGGWVISMLLGVVGSMIGGLVGRAAGLYEQGEATGFVMATIGAIIAVVIYRAIVGGRGRMIPH